MESELPTSSPNAPRSCSWRRSSSFSRLVSSSSVVGCRVDDIAKSVCKSIHRLRRFCVICGWIYVSVVTSDGLGEIFYPGLRWLDIDAQAVLGCGCGGGVADAGDNHAGEDLAQVVRVEKQSKVFDGRRARERDAVGAAREHRTQTPAIEIRRDNGPVRGNNVDTCAGFLKCFRQVVAPDCGARQQDVQPVQSF